MAREKDNTNEPEVTNEVAAAEAERPEVKVKSAAGVKVVRKNSDGSTSTNVVNPALVGIYIREGWKKA